ncbi:DUF4013 domain-containing protein [Halopiger aswanensis]|uniref:Uncharacterized protein DUF4013 n=1 Tax=Halopiger aswanensis TaxID=148449 RepID=A0A419WR45_9EURY|nr:DUF4013 domain-containing protein [Halopiger aswanensis]RKD97940.1 uncharacterized protein DUF4013 [Halopiger aswanensis]
MLTDSLAYLTRSDEMWKTSIIGGLMLLFGFLLFPLFLVWGYVVRVLERTTHGDDEAPRFEDWGEMLIDGAKATVILLAYSLVPIVVGGVLAGIATLVAGGSVDSIGAAAAAVTGLVTFATVLVVAYAVPAAITNFAVEGRLAAGLDVGAIRPILASGTYAVAWLLALAIVVAGSLVTGALNAIPFVGVVLGAIVAFYALVAAYHAIGHAWFDLNPVPLEEMGNDEGDASTERPAI